MVSCRRPDEIADFYRDLFAYLKLEVPAEAVVLPKPGRLDLRRDRIAISAADFAAKYGIIHYVNRLRGCRWT